MVSACQAAAQHQLCRGGQGFPSVSYPQPHTFVCVQVHLHSGVPTGVQDLAGMDPLHCHGESVERRGQDRFSSERLQGVVLTPTMSRLTERREFKEK